MFHAFDALPVLLLDYQSGRLMHGLSVTNAAAVAGLLCQACMALHTVMLHRGTHVRIITQTC